jgi:hypothetical protein
VPLPIAGNMFEDTSPPLTFTGSFPGAQSAQGTLRMSTSSPHCDTGSLAWSATTTSQPPTAPPPQVPSTEGSGAPSGECTSATAALVRARGTLTRARKRTRNAAAGPRSAVQGGR